MNKKTMNNMENNVIKENPPAPLSYVEYADEKLTKTQREILKQLRRKGTILTDNKKRVFVANGATAKRINLLTFCHLLNKGFISKKMEWPYNYVLSETGQRIHLGN